MPRLPGYRERTSFNVFDSFSPRELVSQGDLRSETWALRLFGPANIGHPVRTNTLIVGQFSSDQTAIVCNWYAHTNMAEFPALAAWSHAATATLIVGNSPRLQLQFSELLKSTERDGGRMGELAVTRGDHLARAAYAASLPLTADILDRYASLRPDEQERWRRIAMAVCRGRYQYTEVIIPVRQNYSVRVEADPAATRALLESMPTNVAPQSLIWINLEGIATRDVA